MNDKTDGGGGSGEEIEAAATETVQVAADEAQSFVRHVAWRVLLMVAVLIAHETAIFSWKRMTGQPPPTRRGRVRGL